MANYRIREIAAKERFSDEMTYGAMNKVVKRSQIEEALSEFGAINLIQEAIPEFQLVIPEQHDKLYKRLLRDEFWPDRAV